MHNFLKRLTLIFSFTLPLLGTAQGLEWNVELDALFDNREFSSKYTDSQTIFSTRLSPEIGVSFDQGKHRIMGGASWVQPVTGKFDGKVIPTLYYRYDNQSLKLSLGMFPRTQLFEPQPYWTEYDSLAYHQPNIFGVLVQYRKPQGYGELYLNWRQLRSHTQREAFTVVANGQWSPKAPLIVGGTLYVNHLANVYESPDDQYVNDDIMLNPYVGVDLSGKTILDSLTVKTEYVMTLERDRGEGVWHTPKGFILDVVAEWRFLGIHNTLYAGQSLFPLYAKLGSEFNQGDPYYASSFYNRTDIYAYIFRNRYVNLLASANFHAVSGNLGLQQQIILRVYLDNKTWKIRNQKSAKAERLRKLF